MKKYIAIIMSGLWMLILTTSCRKQLDLAPITVVADGNFFQTADQFDAFVSGIHSIFRGSNSSFQALGELRADIFATDAGSGSTFTGEATAGFERFWTQNINLDAPGVGNYGGFYTNINQINLLISKLNSTTVVTTANKNYYLGIAYGMRAFYYYQLYRSWGAAIIQTVPTTGATIDITNLAKAASSADAVMALIKSDIDLSMASFGTDYSFRANKGYWSKAATEMLKADVYLWTAHRTGGTADATTAKAALVDIQTNIPSLQLLASYSGIFPTTARGNNEIIFACRYLSTEATLGFITNPYLPQTGLIANYYDSIANRQFNVTTDNWGGKLQAPVKITTFRKFNPLDSRRLASIQPAYNKTGSTYSIAGCFADKFLGEQVSGSRALDNDWPIYRYADLLLMKAEAEIILGQDPSVEINLVRARAYGSNYTLATFGYPNQAIDANPNEALLQERLFEFILEGKRWYDLRRFGDSYVYAHASAAPASSSFPLLWPIDRGTLTNNTLLTQTPGYASF